MHATLLTVVETGLGNVKQLNALTAAERSVGWDKCNGIAGS